MLFLPAAHAARSNKKAADHEAGGRFAIEMPDCSGRFLGVA
jgi:hypothetical protein